MPDRRGAAAAGGADKSDKQRRLFGVRVRLERVGGGIAARWIARLRYQHDPRAGGDRRTHRRPDPIQDAAHAPHAPRSLA
ncbi:MAG: hypothetical protein WD825_06900 [Gemmatimonadaceae bacterium]